MEQLSDINEAAINNDRTVTAATKVNGKGLESTTGYINLNPPSVNSNDGGSLRFHYNQSSSATSKIYEDASGRIKLSGNINITGNVESRINLDNDNYLPLRIRRSSLVKGTAPSEIVYTVIPFYGNVMNENSNSRVAMIQHAVDTNNVSSIALAVYGCNSTTDTTTSSIRCYVDGNGNAYTSAPTPATNDNSTKIATTAYVKSNLSNYLPLNCSSTLSGELIFTNNDIVSGTAPASSKYTVYIGGKDGTNKWLGWIGNEISSNNYSRMYLKVHAPGNQTIQKQIVIGVNSNGEWYTEAPTPATNDNSTKIATTAFVNNRLPYTLGTWTPVIRGATTAGAFTYTTQSGSYIKLGRLVYVEFTITANVTTAPTGYAEIIGFPYNASSSSQSILVNISSGKDVFNNTPVMFRVGSNGGSNIYGINETAGSLNPCTFVSGVTAVSIRGSGIYKTNS